MSQKDLLVLFVTLARRPHSRCVSRSIGTTFVRSVSSQERTQSKIILEQKARESAKKIPLHLGVDRNPENRSAISRIPIPRGVKGEDFTPAVLSRPLGQPNPPRPGQNSPIDKRSLSERMAEFEDYGNALQRRQVYLRTYLRPYFQEWKRLEHHKGKSFQSNPRLFRRDKALYFPNIWGQTLSESGDGPDGGRDTTPALKGKISIIGMQANEWAQEQVDTFLSAKDNPELQEIVSRNSPLVQRVDINMTKDWMASLLVKLSRSRLRKKIPKERWDRYFMIKLPRDIRRGLSDETRDAMGLLNSAVGYVYLVDSSCKIRWAGSGHAWDGEVAGLNAAVGRLIEEEKALALPKATPLGGPSIPASANYTTIRP
ncbi:hypothetical protein DV738_g152, partial [Chaetothyriales sp. CBS 135597]